MTRPPGSDPPLQKKYFRTPRGRGVENKRTKRTGRSIKDHHPVLDLHVRFVRRVLPPLPLGGFEKNICGEAASGPAGVAI
jgi:hypothetical protein